MQNVRDEEKPTKNRTSKMVAPIKYCYSQSARKARVGVTRSDRDAMMTMLAINHSHTHNQKTSGEISDFRLGYCDWCVYR
jgi:uncharacterized membrane-anchored protein